MISELQFFRNQHVNWMIKTKYSILSLFINELSYYDNSMSLLFTRESFDQTRKELTLWISIQALEGLWFKKKPKQNKKEILR